MQHPSKPLAKTRQGTLAGSAEQGDRKSVV